MPSVVTSRSKTAMLRKVSRLCLVAGRELPLLLSSTCPVFVQYMSSICPVVYWTCTAQLLHIYCTRFEANPLLTYGNAVLSERDAYLSFYSSSASLILANSSSRFASLVPWTA